MENLDLKDRKILYELDLNCRQSNTQIGKKVGLSRQVVEYRIKRMEEEDIINCFYTVIDAYKLGYTFYRYYINLQSVGKKKTEEIIEHFVNYNKISTLITTRGLYDLIVVFWVNDVAEFYDSWKKTIVKYGNYFAERFFSLYVQGKGYPSSFLLYDESDTINDVKVDRFGITSKIKIDEIDYMLLNEIALNARMPLVELANKIGYSSQNVIYRINKLQKNGIIQSFRTAMNLSKLGYKRYKVNIFLKNYENRMNIVKYIEKTPYIRYFSSSLGLCDLEFEFIVRDADHIIEIIENINDKFPESIRNYNYYSEIVVHKETFLPEMEFK